MSKARHKVSDEERAARVSEALEMESERACPLIVVEWLSESLAKLLRAKFDVEQVPSKDQERLLNGFNAPLASFAMRIAICRAFGLLNQETRQTLDAVRDIRNHCAHDQGIVSFDDAKIIEPKKELDRFVSENYGNDILDSVTTTW